MPKRSNCRKLLQGVTSFLVSSAMVLSLVPSWAFAEESVLGQPEESQQVTEPQTNETPDEGLTQVPDGTVVEDPSDVIADEPAASEQEGEQTSTNEDEPATTPDEEAPAQDEEPTIEAADDQGAQTEADVAAEAEEAPEAHVVYSGHVQNKGWMKEVSDGAMAGTSGKRLRVEALKIRLKGGSTPISGGIKYRMHVQNKGWMNWVKDGQEGGTHGKSLRVEALQVDLYGDIANYYDVWYCVHAQNKGWMAWAMNGDSAGTAAQSLRLEAVKIVLVKKQGGTKPDSSFVTFNRAFDGGPIVRAQAHVQNKGWMSWVGNGSTAGTTGKSLRMEALKVSVAGTGIPGDVLLEGHVQSYGWMGYKSGMAGTTGKSKRLEAVKMKLSGEVAEKYHIYYRAHVSHVGWLGWASDGEPAGSSGMSARVEAVQVRLVRDGDAANLPASPTAEAFLTPAAIRYSARSQSVGWGGTASNGGTAGTTGQSKRMEAFKVRVEGGNLGGGVSYRAYVSGSGWQGSASNDNAAGVSGKGIEAVKVSLNGRVASMYDVYYRAHVANAGWLGWAKNGQTAGAPGTGRCVEAIQIRLVSKNQGAPGSTDSHEIDKSYWDDPMVKKAQGYSSPTGWLILVDTNSCNLCVLKGSKGHWKKYNKWRVTVGAPATPSVHGVFSVGSRGYSFGSGYTCYYWTEWNGPYLFHSTLYDEGTFNHRDPRLGKKISHGCVRMAINNAKWIYDNIPSGTTVVVY